MIDTVLEYPTLESSLNSEYSNIRTQCPEIFLIGAFFLSIFASCRLIMNSSYKLQLVYSTLGHIVLQYSPLEFSLFSIMKTEDYFFL